MSSYLREVSIIKTEQCEQPVPVAGNHPDRLGDIFDTQAYFLRQVADKPPIDFSQNPLRPEDAEALSMWVGEYAKCLMMESSELMDWTPWKHWSVRLGNKKDSEVTPWSPEHVREMRMELADILCFLVNACAVLGMGSADLYRLYREKADINLARQESGCY